MISGQIVSINAFEQNKENMFIKLKQFISNIIFHLLYP